MGACNKHLYRFTRFGLCIGANVEHKDNDGETALLRASKAGKVDAVKALLAAG